MRKDTAKRMASSRISIPVGDTTPFTCWALAIKSAKSTNPDAIRKAILEIRGYMGVEGTYNYDKNGDGVHGYNVVKNDLGKIVYIKYISFQSE